MLKGLQEDHHLLLYKYDRIDTAELRISKCLKLKNLKQFVFEL